MYGILVTVMLVASQATGCLRSGTAPVYHAELDPENPINSSEVSPKFRLLVGLQVESLSSTDLPAPLEQVSLREILQATTGQDIAQGAAIAGQATEKLELSTAKQLDSQDLFTSVISQSNTEKSPEVSEITATNVEHSTTIQQTTQESAPSVSISEMTQFNTEQSTTNPETTEESVSTTPTVSDPSSTSVSEQPTTPSDKENSSAESEDVSKKEDSKEENNSSDVSKKPKRRPKKGGSVSGSNESDSTEM